MRAYRLLPVFVLMMSLSLVGLASARSVYLQDGAILDCESFWRSGGRVVVKVNRDIMLTFAAHEVNLKKTFAGRPGREVKRRVRHVVGSSRQAQVSADSGSPAVRHQEDVAGEMMTTTLSSNTVSGHRDDTPSGGQDKLGGGSGMSGVEPAPDPAASVPPSPVSLPVGAATPVQAAMMSRIGTSAMVAISAVLLFITLLMVAAQWKIYEKAGQAGWKCLIPVYNMYILVLIAGKPWWWFLLMFVPVLGVAVYLLMMLALAERFGKGPLFGVGLFFIPFICYPLLAFDSSEFLGVSRARLS